MTNTSLKDHQKALQHFKKVDPILYKASLNHDPTIMFDVSETTNYFERLCRAIVGQQLSTKAAATIWNRFLDLLPQKQLFPEEIIKIDHEQFRSAGLSNAKARYVRGLAEAVIAKTLQLNNLVTLSDVEIVTELTQIKGIGIWTAEMFLMFTLSRPNIYSLGDLGLKRAIERLYGIENPTTEQLIEISNKWSPYRTYACRILWESLDNTPKAQ